MKPKDKILLTAFLRDFYKDNPFVTAKKQRVMVEDFLKRYNQTKEE